MFETVGMINRGTEAGELIYNFAKNPEIKTIVEIGTWNGLGTTKCLYEGIIDSGKKDYLVLSLECNLGRYNEAKQNLLPLANFNLIYGTVTTFDEILPKMNSENEKRAAANLPWVYEESAHIKAAPLVLDMIPEKIDFIIFDGGEQSSSFDFEKLHERAHYIYLDDTRDDMEVEHFGHVLKNSMQRRYVLEHPEKFRVIKDDQKLGSCGWFVCENLEFVK